VILMRHFPARFAAPYLVVAATWAGKMHGMLGGVDDLAATRASLLFQSCCRHGVSRSWNGTCSCSRGEVHLGTMN
jgi:hypothetical protein